VSGNRWRTFLLAGLSVLGIVLTIRAERSSESRANRLVRNGELELAADLYADRLALDTASARLRYNLGTTLLRMGNPAAATALTAAAESRDETLRIRAEYNLGVWSLIQALFAQSNDSIVFHATNAVEANKEVLRLAPGHPDAPWNLALARRLVVEASPETDPGSMDSPTGAPDLGEIQIVEGPQPFGQDEGFGDSPSEGEEEALAREDMEPLSLAEAGEILGSGHRDPSTMTGKLLLREGRARRRQRIFVVGPPW
jgi:hypothetical protein